MFDINAIINNNLGQIIGFLCGIGVVAKGIHWVYVNLKAVLVKVDELNKVVDGVQHLVAELVGAMEDNTITAEEALEIIRDSKDMVSTFRVLLAKAKVSNATA